MKRFFRRADKHQTSRAIPAGQRVYAIGDIHGRFDLLRNLLLRIEVDSAQRSPARETMVILGDFIDRGPDSAQIIEAFASFKQTRLHGSQKLRRRFVVLKGNHEACLLDTLAGDYDAAELWLEHGGRATLSSFGADLSTIDVEETGEMILLARSIIPASVVDWLKRLPLNFALGGYYFVHAGIRPGIEIAQQSEADQLWIRGEFTECEDFLGAVIVHGHSICEQGVDMRPNRIGVDTGAYRTGLLSAVGLEGHERWILTTETPDEQPEDQQL